MLKSKEKTDILNLSIKIADFLCQFSPLVHVEEHTVFLIDRGTRAFLWRRYES